LTNYSWLRDREKERGGLTYKRLLLLLIPSGLSIRRRRKGARPFEQTAGQNGPFLGN
jgi:hypothetical protein